MIEHDEWEPILASDVAADAWSAIREVARAIADGHGERRTPTELTLFWAYVVGAIDEDWTNAAYDEATEALCACIETGIDWKGLHGGLAGAAWVLAHVSDEDAAESLLASVDATLLSALAVERWQADYDLIGGLVGMGVYFLERIKSSSGLAGFDGLRRVVDHLVSIHEVAPQGTAWFTAPDLVPPLQQSRSPGGYFNLGLAHGVPGVVALLGRIAALPDPDPRAAPLCETTLAWLRAQALPPSPRGRFPATFNRGDTRMMPARTAWCYGDPGVAVASWGAAARIGHSLAEWVDLMKASAKRPAELCGVKDAGFCHGAAGLAHIYNRSYQNSRDHTFRDAARSWFSAVLAMRRPDGVGGFAAWSSGHTTELRWVPAADLVEGVVGVTLALLAAVQPVEPRWDRLFQCDLPTRAEVD